MSQLDKRVKLVGLPNSDDSAQARIFRHGYPDSLNASCFRLTGLPWGVLIVLPITDFNKGTRNKKLFVSMAFPDYQVEVGQSLLFLILS